MSGAQDVPGKTGDGNDEFDLSDLIHSLAFSMLLQTAVYMDVWIIITSFQQTNPQKMNKWF